MHKRLTHWTVDYGDKGAPREVIVPHAWAQDVPVSFEGPVTYRTWVDVPREPSWIVFHGVSYAAEVFVDGVLIGSHKGIWDAFEVPLDSAKGRKAQVEVRVIKNGGPAYPVREVASGFLPYVYHTFGGIYQPVDLVTGPTPPALSPPAPPSRVAVDGSRVSLDGKPFYLRGLLHWGWYPEIGHTNPSDDTIRREILAAKQLGFNLVKFCLWVPPHRYLEIMREEGMEGWLELPLWDPTDSPLAQEEIAREMERIVSQYRRHANLIVWTVGCELSTCTSPEYRRYLTEMVRARTGCPLVKDNSGGAEMYGGDLREFGDFYDFHPYCDTEFYPLVLDSLLPGPRKRRPVLLGETNDVDTHRDLARLGDEMPYWGSSLSELNDQGVRWQQDLPGVLSTNRFATYPTKSGHRALMESSRGKTLFVRKTVQEAMRSRDPIGGYVLTGWRDTPISTAGFFDDWDEPRFSAEECSPWNGPSVLFLIPSRRPPFTQGGNRPGWLDPLNHFVGQIFWRVGIHSETGLMGGLVWRVLDASGRVVGRGAETGTSVGALSSTEIGEIAWYCAEPGDYTLEVEFAGASNAWPMWVVAAPEFHPVSHFDPAGLLEGVPAGDQSMLVATRPPADLAQQLEAGRNVLLLLTEDAVKVAPFWRESAYEFSDEAFWGAVPFAEKWERLLPVTPDRVLDFDALPSLEWEVLMNRIDVRTYDEAPVLARAKGKGTVIATTLRPYGGLGIEPAGVLRNPAGAALLDALLRQLA